jgi:hypothetical protein
MAPTMPTRESIRNELDGRRVKVFERFSNLQRLDRARSGHGDSGRVRHELYAGRAKDTRANALVKLASRPGLVYQQDLANELATLSTINRELPDSTFFPLLWEHGRLLDGRTFLIMSLFDEWPLSTTIGGERRPDRLVAYIRAALEIATALADLHRLRIFHVDLNPMNVLYRSERGQPIVRIVDFESSYEVSRHAGGAAYNPPMTPGFSAPEVADRAPDARADVFSLGAVLYTMLAGYAWRPAAGLSAGIAADPDVDEELKAILLTSVERDPDRRFPSMAEMQARLSRYLEAIWPGRPWS